MQSKVIFTKSLKELNLQIKTTIQEEFHPTLAVVFVSLSHEIASLTAILNKYNIPFIGTTTAGEIGNTTIQGEGISLMLLDIDTAHYKIIQEEADYATSEEVGQKIAKKAQQFFKDPAFIMVFSMNICGETMVSSISKTLNSYPAIFGGMAGDDMQMKQSYTFSNTKAGANMITTLVLDNEHIAVEGMALCGWQPIGIENTITKATDNIIYEINNEPALNMVKRYFGDYYANSLEDSVALGIAQYPLQIIRSDAYVLRAALDANQEDGSLLMAGPVKTGDNFRFSIAPGFEIIDETINGFKGFAKEKKEADALLMFSCVARHMSLGPLIEDEIEGVYNIWKKPMAGFFSYGEVGQQHNKTSHFYNETCSLVLLTERN